MKERFRTWPRGLRILLFVCTLLACLLGVSARTAADLPLLKTRAALQDFNFAAAPAKISRDLFDFYAEKLYTPQDFAAERTGQPTFTVESSHNGDRQYVRYGTYRLTLSLPAGQVYAISSDSATYAQKLWVNGQLLSEVGTVAADAAHFVPRTNHYVVCFTATDAPTEIVVQRANFVHKSGALFELDLGPQTQVFQLVNAKLTRALLELGALFAAALLFFGVSLFFPHRRRFLWFSLGCLCIGVRSSFVSPKPVMILFPSLNWYFGHKLEHCAMVLAYLFILLFFNAVFRDAAPKVVCYTGYGLCLAGFAMYAVLPSTIYSYLRQTTVNIMEVYLLVYAAFFVWGLIHKKTDLSGTPFVLMVCGVCVTISGILADQYLYRKTGDFNFTQIGMLVAVSLMAISLTLQMRAAEDALDEAAAREALLQQKNRDLTDLYRLRSDFLSDISHEMKTPLTVMSSYAGLTKMQLEKDAVDPKTPVHLEIIQREAVRLGALVEQLKTVSSGKNRKALAPARTDAADMLRRAAEFCRPICEKNGNRIETAVPAAPLYARCVPDSVLQVLYNLITNANRHCRGSVIRLQAVQTGAFVTVSVADSGDGIAPALQAHLFERGASGDDSTGLGLPLCREIIENGGGTIRVDSAPGRGTTVTFTLPGEETSDGE